MMTNTLRLTLLSICGLSLASTTYVPTPPPTVYPEGTVEVVEAEIEYEYLPPANVTILHDEVVIVDQRSF